MVLWFVHRSAARSGPCSAAAAAAAAEALHHASCV